MSISTLWQEFKTWLDGTTIYQEMSSAADAAWSELESLAPGALEAVTAATASAILPGITGGAATSAIISAGIDAAEAAFKSQAATVASTTISEFVSTLHNSVSTQVAAGAVTPAPAAS